MVAQLFIDVVFSWISQICINVYFILSCKFLLSLINISREKRFLKLAKDWRGKVIEYTATEIS